MLDYEILKFGRIKALKRETRLNNENKIYELFIIATNEKRIYFAGHKQLKDAYRVFKLGYEAAINNSIPKYDGDGNNV